ncbi:SDR family NAD(P)-dependent oxidoreductase [Roseateles violae]|uniref:Glucose 1-dehydrogenase n=1 Tax=Roseateles violae TaxID=3058042 RepID=A0ABT8DWN3_9BURK|nr:glucose 1-dehydrogenase [Pelomonas sp. PFR6]MDN3921480.1 glucose 1-dehydrogenase [Pelomonas sp. PFR6]
MRMKDRTALVTGAARGIGRAIAQRFVAEGAKVLLADIDEAALKDTAASLNSPFQVVDVADAQRLQALASSAIAELGHLDVLVNNAGIVHGADFLELRVDDFDRVLAINLRSAFVLSQAVARHMVERRSGCIINMSSVNAVLAIPTQLAYAVSKGGMNQLTKASSLALAPYGVRVNGIGPGTILTDLARKIMSDPVAEQRIMSRTPLGRCGDADEVASVAVFLATEDSSYLTGQTIYPDGGRLGLNYVM